MTRTQILFIFFLFISCSAFGQTDFENTLRQSDSIQIISHEDLSKHVMLDGKPKKIRYNILTDGKANKEIVHDQYTVPPEVKETLISLLVNQNKTDYYDEAYCFEPHHAILIFKNGQCLIIDICFHCRHFNASEALGLDPEIFLHSNDDWQKLETFFRKQGIEYQMPKW